MIYTHQKIPYRAYCMQNKGDNAEEILSLLASHGYVPWHPGRDGALYLEHKDDRRLKLGLPVGWWVRIGENDHIKTMSDEEHRLKYIVIKPHG